MADIAPLSPLRFAQTSGLGELIAPPYDVISETDRQALLARSPHNVVRLILPEGQGDAKYAHAADLFRVWQRDEILVRDPEPAFYRYEQTFVPPAGGAPHTRRGFLALVRLVPFSDGAVLPHERTLSGPKEDRLKLFRATAANLSPGFMLYRDPLRVLDAPLSQAQRVAEFVTPDQTEHRLAKITHPQALAAISAHVKSGALVIADGHHRYETALHYASEVDARSSEGRFSALAEHRYFMAFLCNEDDPDLLVLATHRWVHSLPGFVFDDFTRRAASLFQVEEQKGSLEQAIERLHGRAGAFLAVAPEGRIVLLSLREDRDLSVHPTLGSRPEALRSTDVALLHGGVLEDMLGISLAAQAAKTNLTYVQDPQEGARLLARRGGDVLFLMNPTPPSAVRRVAEAGEVMPQKSTYFYPKVMTGLAIHTLDPHRAVATASSTA